MRLLVLGGTRFLGRHVAQAALARGHDVATFTRGVSGEPPKAPAPCTATATTPPLSRRRWTAGNRNSSSTPPGRRVRPPATPPTNWPTSGPMPTSAASTPTATGHPGRWAPRTASRPGTPTRTSTARSRPRASGSSARRWATGS
ncbi:MAG TPA: NAD-dependent epimerase/dehydratase family protein [Blastococcus sp.]